jgi:hypothetical protein
MEDPKYTSSVTIGGPENNSTDYETDCMGDRIHADQSFILQYTLIDGNDSGAFDIASATATLYVTAYKDDDFTPVMLAGGVLTDSGSGTTDRATFTVAKDLIPDALAQFPLRTPGNSVFYAIIEDADSKVEIVNFVNVYDDSYGLTGESVPGASTITPTSNDLGTVTDYLVTTPPTPTLNLAYIVAPSSTGDWAGQDGNLAIGNGTSWIFSTSVEGNFAFDANSNMQILFDGSTWSEEEAPPFTDANALIKNAADNTKLVGFDASAITTATERTITVPDQNIDLTPSTGDFGSASDVTANNAKVTNATHTGEVTGSGALTVDKTAISNKTLVTAAAGDHILAGDASDTDNLKKVTAQTIADLKVTELSEDTTPQLGGSLDVNGNKIVSTANANIDIEPNGTGNVLLGNLTFDADQTVGAGQDDYVLTYDDAAGVISLEASAGGGGSLASLSDVTLTGTAQGDILYRNATEWVNLGPGTSGQFLQTQGAAANPQWSTPSGSGDVVGPASSTDNAIARFDLATGKLIQNSGILIDDSDNMSGVGSINDNGTGGNNNCMGDNAGNALSTGAHNTLGGSGAGDFISSGSQNTGFGSLVIDAATIATNLSGFGYGALTNCTGISNSAFGALCLANITTGTGNAGFGLSAGRFITGGVTANQTSGTSVYFGNDTKASADGNANETVIGYNTTGSGSNTVTIGNTSVTDTYLRGNLQIEEVSAPSTPASGELAIYADSTTSLPMAKNDAGDEIQMGGGVYKTISFNAGGMTPRTTNGAASGTKEYPTNDINLDFFDFDSATNEGVQIAFMLPDDMDLTVDPKFKFIWTTASVAGTGNVQWAVRAVAIPNDSTLDATLGTAQAVTDGFLLADDNHTTAATPLVTIGGSPTLGDLVVFEFYRNAAGGADTYTQDARLLNVTMQYKTLDTVTAAW